MGRERWKLKERQLKLVPISPKILSFEIHFFLLNLMDELLIRLIANGILGNAENKNKWDESHGAKTNQTYLKFSNLFGRHKGT